MPAPPPDVPTAQADTRSCHRKASDPTCVATPASPPAGQTGPAPLGCQAFAPLRPAWRFHPLHWLRLINTDEQLFPDGWPMLFQMSRKVVNRHAVHAGVPLVGLDSLQCLLARHTTKKAEIGAISALIYHWKQWYGHCRGMSIENGHSSCTLLKCLKRRTRYLFAIAVVWLLTAFAPRIFRRTGF